MRNFVQKVYNVYPLVFTNFDARDVFCCPRVAELPACVLSVAGAMRTGKSFLLDQMVSFIYSLDCQVHQLPTSIGLGNLTRLNPASNALDRVVSFMEGSPAMFQVQSLAPGTGAGFSWRGGMARHTSGIHICAEVSFFPCNFQPF